MSTASTTPIVNRINDTMANINLIFLVSFVNNASQKNMRVKRKPKIINRKPYNI